MLVLKVMTGWHRNIKICIKAFFIVDRSPGRISLYAFGAN